METPKIDRSFSFAQFQNSPCPYFNNKENQMWNEENFEHNEKHERIFAPCIIQQHDSMLSPSRLLNLSSPAPFLKGSSEVNKPTFVMKRLYFGG